MWRVEACLKFQRETQTRPGATFVLFYQGIWLHNAHVWRSWMRPHSQVMDSFIWQRNFQVRIASRQSCGYAYCLDPDLQRENNTGSRRKWKMDNALLYIHLAHFSSMSECKDKGSSKATVIVRETVRTLHRKRRLRGKIPPINDSTLWKCKSIYKEGP